MKARNPVIIETTRGSLIENAHQVIYVVVDLKGQVVDFHGNIDFVVSPRSSVKWLQALPFVLSGAIEKFDLEEKHLALACSSHKAEAHHLDTLKNWIEKLKISEDVLECGPAAPTKTAISHNCSGKHLGFISTALTNQVDPKKYSDYFHPIQELQRKIMTEIFGLDFSKLPYGGDGCGIPTFGVPIIKLAQAINYLCRKDIPTAPLIAAQRILTAIKKYPEYVSGQNELTTQICQATRGKCLMKTGADGIYTGLVPEKGISFAVKTIDGHSASTEFVCMELFKKWGGLFPDEIELMKKIDFTDVLDSRGIKVGQVRIQPGTM